MEEYSAVRMNLSSLPTQRRVVERTKVNGMKEEEKREFVGRLEVDARRHHSDPSTWIKLCESCAD